MNERDLEVLNSSTEPRELKKLANKLAASDDKQELGALLKFLDNPDFLGRLDSAENYTMPYSSLRLASVINMLMKNPAELADKAILHLINAGNFGGNVQRMQLLIFALSVVRPLPPQAINYLTQVGSAESPLLFDVVESLCINQSEPAMQLLVQKFSQLQLPEELQKITWLRQVILPRRNDTALLLSCEQLIGQPMGDEFKSELVDVLFDYKPDDWYMGCNQPKPPPRQMASVGAREVLRRIGAWAITNEMLEPEQREKVTEVLEEIA